jgi:hypothetical protein
MAKLAGRFIKVYIDDSGGVAREVSGDVNSVDIPWELGELDVTGFNEGSVNSIPGMPSFNLEISGTFNPTATTGLFTVLKDIVGDYATHTVTVQVGQNASPTTGDPEFEGEFWCSKMNITTTPSGKVEISGSFRVWGATAPAWGTVA